MDLVNFPVKTQKKLEMEIGQPSQEIHIKNTGLGNCQENIPGKLEMEIGRQIHENYVKKTGQGKLSIKFSEKLWKKVPKFWAARKRAKS